MTYFKSHWQLLVLTGVVFAFWQTPVVVPLKILIVFLHELSHALAALLTGGSVVQISLSPDQGGFAITRGGNLFVILTAGYLGSLVLGVMLLMVALRSTADRGVIAILGAVMLAVAVLFVRDLFAAAFCLGAGLSLLTMARFLGHGANDLALRVIGLSSLIYVPYDIFDDTIARASQRSDAYMLAEAFGGTAMLWGALWLAISLLVIAACLHRVLGASSNIALPFAR
ncbi:M50 family metallopeptidase [Sulfitobacter guttiformis]|uniref:Peptidase M50B-like protein n=1 Tax=Sulfitobacter guttiformis TaxID=74349 RepID=A0A420DIK5_9RHOB|nr:M50 family metallopeptidase [Sulfitobacter guttiformis]KIN72167.1 Peptidase M50B domain containing protein [Sulfitobacter guttiformis KCTC 32187]RKE94060.1 peptidase M50B-like protein [Sulfitobacter guttiformis]